MIGILLGVVAFQLATRNADSLIGGQATATLRDKVREMIASQPGILAVTDLLVTFIGPRQAWVAIDKAMSGASVEVLVRTSEETLKDKLPFIARVDVVPRGR